MAIYYGDGSNSSNGRIVAVHTKIKTNTQSFSANTGTFHNISGMLMQLTPKSSTSLFLIHISTNYSTTTGQRGTFRLLTQIGGGGYGYIANSVADASSSVQRGFVPSIATADNDSRSVPVSMVLLHDPGTTSQIDYTLQVEAESSAGTIWLNRTQGNNSSSTYHAGITTMMVYEVAHA